jgi:dienelactone hydrolase
MKMRAKYQFIIILITLTNLSYGQTIGNKQKIAFDTALFIGSKQYSWEDTDRQDEYYGETRKVNVQVWYPANKVTSSSLRTPYLLFIKKLYNKLEGWSEADYKSIQEVKTASFIDIPIKENLTKAPLLIFSPSLGGNLSYYTYYAEYFAMKGYIVMGINHLYESEAVVVNEQVYLANHSFQDSLKSLKIPDDISAEQYRELMGIRQKVLAQDIQFSLNKLLADESIISAIDTSKIGIFGHSIGGAGAVYCSILDKRIKVVINLDGTPPSIALNNGIDIPYLFIEDLTDYKNHEGYAIQYKRRSDFCELNRADSWRVLIKGFNHNSFLDINYYLADNSLKAQSEKANLNKVISYMDDFLNHYLLGSDELHIMPIESGDLEIIRFNK